MATKKYMDAEKKDYAINGGLQHEPIVYVDYETTKLKDITGDAKILSVGVSQWSQENSIDYSGKVFRLDDNGNWARQSEELPLWRVLDLARLVVAVIMGCDSGMNEKEVAGTKGRKAQLENFIQNHMNDYLPRIEALKNVIIAGQQNRAKANKSKTVK